MQEGGIKDLCSLTQSWYIFLVCLGVSQQNDGGRAWVGRGWKWPFTWPTATGNEYSDFDVLFKNIFDINHYDECLKTVYEVKNPKRKEKHLFFYVTSILCCNSPFMLSPNLSFAAFTIISDTLGY